MKFNKYGIVIPIKGRKWIDILGSFYEQPFYEQRMQTRMDFTWSLKK